MEMNRRFLTLFNVESSEKRDEICLSVAKLGHLPIQMRTAAKALDVYKCVQMFVLSSQLSWASFQLPMTVCLCCLVCHVLISYCPHDKGEKDEHHSRSVLQPLDDSFHLRRCACAWQS